MKRLIVFDSGIMTSSFKDTISETLKMWNLRPQLFSGSTITINADKGNNAGVIVIKDLPLEESKQFYSVLQEMREIGGKRKENLILKKKSYCRRIQYFYDSTSRGRISRTGRGWHGK